MHVALTDLRVELVHMQQRPSLRIMGTSLQDQRNILFVLELAQIALAVDNAQLVHVADEEVADHL